MALTLTVGENTYIARADATSYFEGRLYSTAWTNASDTEKDQALVMATSAVDRLPLLGVKKDSDQGLQFPRCYVRWPFGLSRVRESELPERDHAGYYCEVATPQAVLDAVCEEALALLDRGNSSRYRLQADGVESFSVGNLSESYRGGKRTLVSSEARELLRPYQAGAVGIS